MTLTLNQTEITHLPLLEESLALEIDMYVTNGLNEAEWRSACHRLAGMSTAANLPGADAANRLEQAVSNLKQAHLWPW